VIRPATADDAPFMWDMLWEATAISDEMKALGKATALRRPEVAKYLADWGRPGDVGCLFLTDRNEPVGSAWYRIFPRENPGYGFVDDGIPELTIGVLESARGEGAGSAMLGHLIDHARKKGYTAISLSVDRDNPARRLYERYGFVDAGVSQDTDRSVTLVIRWEAEASDELTAASPAIIATNSSPASQRRMDDDV
jgi:ribosomal protein S18 acetylase RimI-like enzyme